MIRRGGRSATAARTPFVVLVVTLLAGGLMSLLLLNAAVNQDSFELNKLQKETTGYTDEQQALQQDVDGYSAPGSLQQRARQLGMVPGGDPAFLDPNGTVRGTASPATAPPQPLPTEATPAFPTVTVTTGPTTAADPGGAPAAPTTAPADTPQSPSPAAGPPPPSPTTTPGR